MDGRSTDPQERAAPMKEAPFLNDTDYMVRLLHKAQAPSDRFIASSRGL
jgi:hypothetical protein